MERLPGKMELLIAVFTVAGAAAAIGSVAGLDIEPTHGTTESPTPPLTYSPVYVQTDLVSPTARESRPTGVIHGVQTAVAARDEANISEQATQTAVVKEVAASYIATLGKLVPDHEEEYATAVVKVAECKKTPSAANCYFVKKDKP